MLPHQVQLTRPSSGSQLCIYGNTTPSPYPIYLFSPFRVLILIDRFVILDACSSNPPHPCTIR